MKAQLLTHYLSTFPPPAENRSAHAVVRGRQLGLLSLPNSGGAALHHAPCRYYAVSHWKQLAPVF